MGKSMLNKKRGKDLIGVGVRIGGRVKAAGVSGEIKEFCSSPLVNICFLLVPGDSTADDLLRWAAEFRETKTYFFLNSCFFYSFTNDIKSKICEIAGEFYLGAFVSDLNEYGTRTATITYSTHLHERAETLKITDLNVAFDEYVEEAQNVINKFKSLYGGVSAVIEATPLLKYLYKTDIDFIISEVLTGNLDYQVAYSRGAARGYKKEKWGNLIAHEWYGGIRNDDPLKYKRLKLIYDYLYMSGSSCLFIESGEFSIKSYGYDYDINHKFCKDYRNKREEFTKSILNDIRPSGNPLCKVGILHGNLDPFVGFFSSALMYHRDNESWTMQDAERSWQLLENIKQSTVWHNPAEYGDYAYSNAPGYGDYDIVPVESDLDVLCEYEYLMFLGWNTMTEDIYEKLKSYVAKGGNLLISAAHLNTNPTRNGEFIPINDGKLADFLGCDVKGKIRAESSVKFVENSMMEGVLYPVAKTEAGIQQVDPLFPCGNIDLVAVECKGCKVIAYSNNARLILPEDPPVLLENRYGKGIVTFVPMLNYPADSENRFFYSYIMKALFNASHRTCDVKVIANDKIKFNVYDSGEGKKKVYLLNSDFSLSNSVIIKTDIEQVEIKLKSLERKEIMIRT